ncbi:MAG: 5-formyltetrahydrofolate cyclo-ligase [Muribaculaceae bacterium]|nr:5-formyltetrahydrofolate cyclo-ligase [Muribaculaceae bacterium]
MKKDEIRRHVRNHKSLLTDEDRRRAAEAVFSRLETLTQFLLADNILVYYSLPDELSTLEFIDRWHGRKHFFLPRVNGLDLDILPYERTRLHLGAFRIEEPLGDETADIADIDLIIVPAVAFDPQGNRVGRGRGYYDRLLARAKSVTIGVGYDFQLFDSVETEPHDIPLDIVITETHCHRPRRR